MRAFVTGANGMVGRALCRRLQLDGFEVIAAVRRDPGDLPGVIVKEIGDLGPTTDWKSVAGADLVFHLAAHVHRMELDPQDPLAFRNVNVHATASLAAACASVGVSRLVLLSTVKVLGEAEPGRPFLDSDPARPADDYARSKLDGERAVVASGVPCTVLRPPLVYGPRMKANFLRLLDLVARGVPLPFASVQNARSLVYVGNLVDALIACATHEAAVRRTYLVRDGEDLSTAALIRRLAAALGTRPRLVPFPPGLMKRGAELLGRGKAAARLLESLRVDDSKLRSDLGWSAPFGVDVGFRDTIDWYRNRGRRR